MKKPSRVEGFFFGALFAAGCQAASAAHRLRPGIRPIPTEASPMQTVLFLCTGNYYRSRFAECFFNSVARREGLAWSADSRGLALERGVDNVGPMSCTAMRALEELGVVLTPPLRFPLPLTEDDLQRARRIVALKEAEHRPLVLERFPAWIEQIEYWHVHDLDAATPEEALPQIRQEVLRLVDRLKSMATA
jgi:protein-tyrosine phosphatase